MQLVRCEDQTKPHRFFVDQWQAAGEVETFCISAVKATAAGATVLTVPNGAVPEVAPDAYFCRNGASYGAQLIELLKNPDSVATRRALAKKAIARFAWSKVAEGFSKVWSVRRDPKVLDAIESAPTAAA